MNIYSKKRHWKFLLLLAALGIVITSLWYTNGFIAKLAQNEKVQVELWANAISRKAILVKHTEKLFENLRNKERRYVYLWTEAAKMLITAENTENIDFYTNVISGNQDIPVIVTDADSNINAFKNLNPEHKSTGKLSAKDIAEFTDYAPIVVPYFEDKYNYIYYRNSNTYYELKNTLDDLSSSFLDEIVNNNLSAPVIITDSARLKVIAYGGGFDTLVFKDSAAFAQKLASMESDNTPIRIELPYQGINYIFYEESPNLRRVRYFPPVLLTVIGLFLIISYVLFSISRRNEQSKVWAGMAKETAHQLGTPISSLMGWLEMLKINNPDLQGITEMSQDIDRLKLVSERFSKIGSQPELVPTHLLEIIHSVVDYMQLRAPRKVKIDLVEPNFDLQPIRANAPLMIWVFENLIRNAIDAIGSEAGKITIHLETSDKNLIIDVTDTGKGIPASQQKAIFNPGFSTKARGWGLGLSLARRIITEYHGGKIFLKKSTIGVGSTFRIILHFR